MDESSRFTGCGLGVQGLWEQGPTLGPTSSEGVSHKTIHRLNRNPYKPYMEPYVKQALRCAILPISDPAQGRASGRRVYVGLRAGRVSGLRVEGF